MIGIDSMRTLSASDSLSGSEESSDNVKSVSSTSSVSEYSAYNYNVLPPSIGARISREHWEKIDAYVKDHIRELKGFDEPTVLRREKTGLARTIAVHKESDGLLSVHVLLKRKMKTEITDKSQKNSLEIGRGLFKTATFAVDLFTGEKMCWQSEIRNSPAMSLNEVRAISELKGVEGFVGGTVYKYYFKDPSGQELEYKFGFLVPYFNQGTLEDTLQEKISLPFKTRVNIAFDIAKALTEMHAKGFIHRDIKPDNIFLKKTPLGLRAALGDLTFYISEEEAITKSDIPGTPGYADPQFVWGTPRAARSRTTDVWAFGMTLYEIFNYPGAAADSLGYQIDIGQPMRMWPGAKSTPFSETNESTIKKAIHDWKVKNLPRRHTKDSCNYVVARCIEFEPEARATMEEVRDLLDAIRNLPPPRS